MKTKSLFKNTSKGQLKYDANWYEDKRTKEVIREALQCSNSHNNISLQSFINNQSTSSLSSAKLSDTNKVDDSRVKKQMKNVSFYDVKATTTIERKRTPANANTSLSEHQLMGELSRLSMKTNSTFILPLSPSQRLLRCKSLTALSDSEPTVRLQKSAKACHKFLLRETRAEQVKRIIDTENTSHSDSDKRSSRKEAKEDSSTDKESNSFRNVSSPNERDKDEFKGQLNQESTNGKLTKKKDKNPDKNILKNFVDSYLLSEGDSEKALSALSIPTANLDRHNSVENDEDTAQKELADFEDRLVKCDSKWKAEVRKSIEFKIDQFESHSNDLDEVERQTVDIWMKKFYENKREESNYLEKLHFRSLDDVVKKKKALIRRNQQYRLFMDDQLKVAIAKAQELQKEMNAQKILHQQIISEKISYNLTKVKELKQNFQQSIARCFGDDRKSNESLPLEIVQGANLFDDIERQIVTLLHSSSSSSAEKFLRDKDIEVSQKFALEAEKNFIASMTILKSLNLKSNNTTAKQEISKEEGNLPSGSDTTPGGMITSRRVSSVPQISALSGGTSYTVASDNFGQDVIADKVTSSVAKDQRKDETTVDDGSSGTYAIVLDNSKTFKTMIVPLNEIDLAVVPESSSFDLYRKTLAVQAETEESYANFKLDSSSKKLRFSLQKVINTAINEICTVSGKVIREKIEHLHGLLSGKPVRLPGKNESVTATPEALPFVMDLLAKKIVKQGEDQIASHPDSAFVFGAFARCLCLLHPDTFAHLLLVHFFTHCPYLVPLYVIPRDSQSISSSSPEDMQSHYRLQGYAYHHNEREEQEDFLKRMRGITHLYLCILTSQIPNGLLPTTGDPTLQSKNEKTINFLSLSTVWSLLTQLLNMDPRIEITASILSEILTVTGFHLSTAYSTSFRKLLTYINSIFLPKIREISAKRGGAAVPQIEIFIEDYVKNNGNIPFPKGYLNERFFFTSVTTN